MTPDNQTKKHKCFYFTIFAVLIVLIWFSCGIFNLVSLEVFWSGLIGFLVGSLLMDLERRYKDD